MWLLMICKLCMVCGTNKEIISKGKYLFEVVYLKIVSCHFSHHASLCSEPLIIVGVFPGVEPHNNRMIDASRHRTCPWISTASKTLNSTEKINLNYTHKHCERKSHISRNRNLGIFLFYLMQSKHMFSIFENSFELHRNATYKWYDTVINPASYRFDQIVSLGNKLNHWQDSKIFWKSN